MKVFVIVLAKLHLVLIYLMLTISAKKCSLQKWYAKARYFLLRILSTVVMLVTTALLSQYILVQELILTHMA